MRQGLNLNNKFKRLSYNKFFCSFLAAFLTLIFLSNNKTTLAQGRSGEFGIKLSSSFTESGIGVFYGGAVFYTTKRNTFSIGANFQKYKLHNSGIQLGYEFTILDEDETSINRVGFFTFINSNYNYNSMFGKSALDMEYRVTPQSAFNLDNAKFNTIETYVGFGLRINIFKKIKWVNAIGIGEYSMINTPKSIYHKMHSAGIFLSTGISYQF